MKGKNKCKILKQIRQKIADENDIPYVTRECTYRGDCAGTCPKCEAELRYLEQELEKRRNMGRKVALAAVAAGLSMTVAGCIPKHGGTQPPAQTETPPTAEIRELAGDVAVPDPETKPSDFTDHLMGEIWIDPNETEEPLAGAPEEIPPETWEPLEGEPEYIPESTEEPFELAGDVEFIPEANETESSVWGDTEAPDTTAEETERR